MISDQLDLLNDVASREAAAVDSIFQAKGLPLPKVISAATKSSAFDDVISIVKTVQVESHNKSTAKKISLVLEWLQELASWLVVDIEEYQKLVTGEEKKAWAVTLVMHALEEIEKKVDVVPNVVQPMVFWAIRRTVDYMVERAYTRLVKHG